MVERKTSPWIIAFRVVFTIALIWCVFFIFSNSLQIGEVSSVRSQQAMEIINKVLGKIGLGPLSEYYVRKIGHFAEFTLLGFLLMMCLRVYTSHFIRHTSWPLLLGLITALTDETLQMYVPGRSSQVKDVWIDMSGVVMGIIAALVILLIVRMALSLHNTKKEIKRLREEKLTLEKRQKNKQPSDDTASKKQFYPGTDDA